MHVVGTLMRKGLHHTTAHLMPMPCALEATLLQHHSALGVSTAQHSTACDHVICLAG